MFKKQKKTPKSIKNRNLYERMVICMKGMVICMKGMVKQLPIYQIL
jgi:hypothetical protein